MRKSTINLVLAFVLGASVAGGIAVAEINNTGGVKACVDNKTKVLYLSADGKCAKGRSPLELTTNAFDVKNLAATITPSVVSIAETFRNKFKFISILPTADNPPPPIPISLHVILEDRSLDSILSDTVTKGTLGTMLLHLIS